MTTSKSPSRSEPYKRILLKLSGEALAGEAGYGIDTQVLNDLAREIKAVHESGNRSQRRTIWDWSCEVAFDRLGSFQRATSLLPLWCISKLL